ncbi:hypothetical protein G7046_g9623 [Stylonectria norvegica]|nr:hypothetical protein G7046_g9623 [Stylonectria norvegica]
MPLIDPVTMSTMKTSGSSHQAFNSKAAVPPVPHRDGPVALGVAVGHPLLLAALFVWRFDALVVEPVSTLQTALPVVAAVQVAYAVLSLPIAGSQGKTFRKSRPGEKKKADTGPNPIVVST